MADGRDPETCQQVIESESVDGAWCDGQIVIDEQGHRCVSQEMLDRVARARAASPLPPRTTVTSDAPIVTVNWPLAGMALAGALVLYLALR